MENYDLVVLDFETTGFSPALGDRPIEVGAVLLRKNKVIDEFQSLMNPGFRISNRIENLTQITNSMLIKAPPCEDVMERFAKFLGDRPIVAHNVSFDRKFLVAELDRIGRTHSGLFACTMMNARRIFPDAPNHRLETLVEFLGIANPSGFHRALVDARMAMEIWFRLEAEIKSQDQLKTVSFELMKNFGEVRFHRIQSILKNQAETNYYSEYPEKNQIPSAPRISDQEKHSMDNRDQIACAKIKTWLESRKSERIAWKKISNLMSMFGAKRLTKSLKNKITDSLFANGIQIEPPMDELGPLDTIYLHSVNYSPVEDIPEETNESIEESDALPNQIAAWHQQNIGDDDPDDQSFTGQYLWCLKATTAGDRQIIWEGTSGRGIVGVVTYGDPQIQEGNRYARWGRFQMFTNPISRDRLLSTPATSNRFSSNGIRALQGSAIRLTEKEAKAIVKLLGGLRPTRLPIDSPDWSEELGHWTGKDGLAAETIAENAICSLPYLHHALGLRGKPKRQVRLGPGRADIVCGNTIIEVKRAVTTNNGPDQIEGYLQHLAESRKSGKRGLRGILVQQFRLAGAGMKQRLAESPFRLELWAVYQNEDNEWELERLL